MKSRTLAVGDIHGAYNALKQVLNLSKFDYENDNLICLGDIVDGHPQVKECVDELLKIKNLVFVCGNHDNWWIRFFENKEQPNLWIVQGGYNTLKSYGYIGDADRLQYGHIVDVCDADLSSVIIPEEHKEFFRKSVPYYINNNRLFVHGGVNPNKDIGEQSFDFLTWDRELIEKCRNGKKIKQLEEVFVGHTTTQHYGGGTFPLNYGQLWMLDTGAGWNGKLTIMDVDTKEYWQSDKQTGSGR